LDVVWNAMSIISCPTGIIHGERQQYNRKVVHFLRNVA